MEIERLQIQESHTKPTFRGPCPTGRAVTMQWRFGGLPSARIRVIYCTRMVSSILLRLGFLWILDIDVIPIMQ